MSARHDKCVTPQPEEAPPGRSQEIRTSHTHFVFRAPLKGPFPENAQTAMFGLGCFWGAERLFWRLPGVISTAVGYAGGFTPNPTYEEVCAGRTGHNEVVRVIFDPDIIGYEDLLVAFFEAHDPTQGMRQGNDVGTQYRSGIYCFDEEQKELARRMKAQYERRLRKAGAGMGEKVTTEIMDAPVFYYAEEYHQQYLAKNPNGYCGLSGTGVSCA
jgi:peptide-methionine (S)-S-oxide reductase